jgi:periplasmic protein TonB
LQPTGQGSYEYQIKNMASYAHDPGYAQRRTTAFIAILVFHAFLIYGIATGLVQDAVKAVTEPFVTKIIEEEKVKDDLPPPPPPEMERPPVQIVMPDIAIPLTADAPPPPIAIVTTRPVISAPPRPPLPGTKMARVSGPSAEDYYPSSAKIASQEGRPLIKVCISANGKLESADVAESSGFPALDEAAVRLAKASRFKAATEEGKAIQSCANLPIKFSLKKVKE